MNVLHQFTWQQFGITATVLAVIWYGVVWLVYYRKSPQGTNSTATAAKEPLPHYWENEDFDEELFGGAAEDEGVSLVPADGFRFAGKPRDERENMEDALRGLIPDVLEEIKTIVHTVETKGGDKTDFISLFKLVSAKYDRLKTSHHLEAINEWIADNTPFNLTGEELWQLWK